MFTIIYGIKKASDATSISSLGASAIGFNLSELSLDQIHDIVSQLPTTVTAIITSHAINMSDLSNQCSRLNQTNIFHIGSHPDKIFPQEIHQLKSQFSHLKFIQVIPVIDRYSIEIAQRYENVVDYILLDSFNIAKGLLGTTGETHDWSISAEIVKTVSTPIILAGGLGPENVSAAIKIVHPWGVATKTRTDLPDGSGKDLEKVRLFLTQSINQFT